MIDKEVIDQLISATQLPVELISKELELIMGQSLLAPIELDELRDKMVVYLQAVLIEAKKEFGA